MKADGLDIDVGIEGVLIEENRAACVMGLRGSDLEECHDRHIRMPPAR